MNKALAFVKLDFFTIRPYFRSILYLIGIGLFMAVMQKSGDFLPGIYMAYSLFVISYPFAISDKNDLEILYSTLALTRKNVVVGRYLFAIAIQLLVSCFTLAVSFFMALIFHSEWNALDTLVTIFSCFGIYILFASFQIPIYFKYGYTKGRVAAMIPLMILFVGVFALPAFVNTQRIIERLNVYFQWIELNPAASVIGVLGVCIAVVSTSMFISYKAYQKRVL